MVALQIAIGWGKRERLLGKSLGPNQLTPNKFHSQESQVTEPSQQEKKDGIFISNYHLRIVNRKFKQITKFKKLSIMV
jgi:hypothetical protein